MGLPAAGKSRLAQAMVRDGYVRLNRDEGGGRLAALLPELEVLLASGRTRVVLDNTYATRKSRAAVVEAAARHGVPVRCVWLDTRVEDAQVNAARRQLERYGHLLEPEELRTALKRDPGAFPPGVLFRYQRDLEPPAAVEGFSKLEVVGFQRARDESFTNRALVVWLDDIVWRSRSGSRTPVAPEDVELVPGRAEVLRRHAAEGYKLFGLSWQPAIAAGQMSRAAVAACAEALGLKLGLALEVSCCPHAAGPPVCWCRKPLPGLGVELILKHRLDPARCLYVGGTSLDRTFAARLGFEHRDPQAFFAATSLSLGFKPRPAAS
jgi:histidinol phosphatase-like enzyme